MIREDYMLGRYIPGEYRILISEPTEYARYDAYWPEFVLAGNLKAERRQLPWNKFAQRYKKEVLDHHRSRLEQLAALAKDQDIVILSEEQPNHLATRLIVAEYVEKLMQPKEMLPASSTIPNDF